MYIEIIDKEDSNSPAVCSVLSSDTDYGNNSNSQFLFGDVNDETLDASDFLDFFDGDYEILDLWSSLKLLKKGCNPVKVFNLEDLDIKDNYSTEYCNKIEPYILRVFNKKDFEIEEEEENASEKNQKDKEEPNNILNLPKQDGKIEQPDLEELIAA